MKRFVIIIILMSLLLSIKSSANDATSTLTTLTPEEKGFIKEHPSIRLGVDPEFTPYEFFDTDGQYKGIAADYIELLSKKTGIQMIIEPNKTWPEAYEMAVEKKLDVLPCVSKTTERQQYFIFSNPYFSFQRVVIVQEDNTTIKTIEDLEFTTTAVQENSSHHSYLKNIPEINLSLYASVEEGIAAVSKGYETSFVGNLATSSYLIKSKGLTGLKYVSLDSDDEQHLYFAVRDDWPLLVSIINKGLSSITEEEKMVINDKWIGLEKHIDYSNLIKIIVIVSIVMILIFFVSIYWIVRLKKEIAKRVLIEKALENAKSEAEIANRVKSTFLARMSHEIRTPLNAIIGMSYLIKKNDISYSQKRYVDKITQAAHNMLGIINDILDFSKIEAGKIEIENISFNMDNMIQQVISILSFKIEEQGIGFAMTKEPQIPVHFIGDSKRIEQILLNLLSNAVKFTTEGEVSLSIRLVAKEGDFCYVEFSVKDTGIGMTEDQITKLFLPFSQADSSITRRFGGTGLGLSITKNLVDLMHGEIHIYSAIGKGSTFSINLPLLVDASQESEEKEKSSSLYVQDIKTLVLLNSESLKNIIETYLVNFGIHAKFTQSPSDALQLFKTHNTNEQNPFDLLIVDYDILSEKSFEFTNRILNDTQILIKPKIIMLIPFMQEDLFEKVECFNLNLGIIKPIIPSVLFNGIQEIFKKNDLESSFPIPLKGEEKKASKNYNVLVVEDNKTNQFIAQAILEQVGITVALANNGEEGATYYADHNFEIDLILMDLHMPILNGYDATLRIRLYDSDVPIVAMTADAITGIEEQCKSVGINYYISKPFEPDKFIDTVLEILDQHSSENPDTESDVLEEVTLPQTPPLINQEDALKLLGNNLPLYHMVLKEYTLENEATCDELDKEIQNNNYHQAAQIVHKAKGSSGNIGANELYKLAIVFQKSLENNELDKISILHPEFDRLLNQTLLEIKELLKG